MATYKKPLKTVVFTLLDGSTVTAADTATAQIGSNAFAKFEAFETVVVAGATTTYIPFHAILKAVVTVAQSEDITKPDAYGCE